MLVACSARVAIVVVLDWRKLQPRVAPLNVR
jgi:hypothetical protein